MKRDAQPIKAIHSTRINGVQPVSVDHGGSITWHFRIVVFVPVVVSFCKNLRLNIPLIGQIEVIAVVSEVDSRKVKVAPAIEGYAV